MKLSIVPSALLLVTAAASRKTYDEPAIFGRSVRRRPSPIARIRDYDDGAARRAADTRHWSETDKASSTADGSADAGTRRGDSKASKTAFKSADSIHQGVDSKSSTEADGSAGASNRAGDSKASKADGASADGVDQGGDSKRSKETDGSEDAGYQGVESKASKPAGGSADGVDQGGASKFSKDGSADSSSQGGDSKASKAASGSEDGVDQGGESKSSKATGGSAESISRGSESKAAKAAGGSADGVDPGGDSKSYKATGGSADSGARGAKSKVAKAAGRSVDGFNRGGESKSSKIIVASADSGARGADSKSSKAAGGPAGAKAGENSPLSRTSNKSKVADGKSSKVDGVRPLSKAPKKPKSDKAFGFEEAFAGSFAEPEGSMSYFHGIDLSLSMAWLEPNEFSFSMPFSFDFSMPGSLSAPFSLDFGVTIIEPVVEPAAIVQPPIAVAGPAVEDVPGVVEALHVEPILSNDVKPSRSNYANRPTSSQASEEVDGNRVAVAKDNGRQCVFHKSEPESKRMMELDFFYRVETSSATEPGLEGIEGVLMYIACDDSTRTRVLSQVESEPNTIVAMDSAPKDVISTNYTCSPENPEAERCYIVEGKVTLILEGGFEEYDEEVRLASYSFLEEAFALLPSVLHNPEVVDVRYDGTDPPKAEWADVPAEPADAPAKPTGVPIRPRAEDFAVQKFDEEPDPPLTALLVGLSGGLVAVAVIVSGLRKMSKTDEGLDLSLVDNKSSVGLGDGSAAQETTDLATGCDRSEVSSIASPDSGPGGALSPDTYRHSPSRFFELVEDEEANWRDISILPALEKGDGMLEGVVEEGEFLFSESSSGGEISV